MTPVRIQRSRAKGFKHPPNTLFVTRPLPHGNPYKIIEAPYNCGYRILCGKEIMKDVETEKQAREISILWFRGYVGAIRQNDPVLYNELIEQVCRADYIACSCKLSDICHGDVWIELARPGAEPESSQEGLLS